MPESRFVSAGRLMVMLSYVAAAVVILLLVELLLETMSAPRAIRRWVVLAWLGGLPVGGWLVWRRTRA